jgi:plastocyanin
MPFFSSVVLALAAAISSVAGFTPYSQVYQVQVGANGNLTFDPETIVANVGDQVVYNFHPKVSFPF